MDTIILNKNYIADTIQKVVQIIKDGGVVVTPSETQYGLSADPTNSAAVEKIMVIKNRQSGLFLGLVAGSFEIINKFFQLNEKETLVANKFWPGPLGLELVPRNNDDVQTLLKNTLGERFDSENPENNKKVIRVTSDLLLAGISNALGLPIVSTSANISGSEPCYSLACVKEQFKDNQIQPDLFINGGELKPIPPSTMLDLSGDTPRYIRQGTDFENIKKFIETNIL